MKFNHHKGLEFNKYGEAIGYTWENKGPRMYLEFVDFRYICDARICDELTVISSVEAIPQWAGGGFDDFLNLMNFLVFLIL